MKKSIITSILFIGLILFGSSCINDDNFIQEGVLKVTFSDAANITNDTKIVIDVMDISDREHVILTKESVGKRPVEITLNTGNYLVRVMADGHTTLRAFQIQKDKIYEMLI